MAAGFGEAMLAGDAAGAEPEPFLLYADEADALTAFKQLLQQTVEFNHDVRVRTLPQSGFRVHVHVDLIGTGGWVLGRAPGLCTVNGADCPAHASG